jgi:hypothetical protein
MDAQLRALREGGSGRIHEQETESSIMIIRRPGDNDRTSGNEPTTYHALAQAGIELEGTGRFAAQQAVVGRDPSPYPAQPAGPWAGADPVPSEEPLGESVERVEPVGTPAEVQASIERLERKREGGE